MQRHFKASGIEEQFFVF